MGYRVLGTDAFYPVARFWQALKHCPEELHAASAEFLPGLDKESFKLLQEELRFLNDTQGDPMRTATLFFVVNRCSFSGTTLSGGMSPGCARFTQGSVDRLLQVDVSNVEVRHGDYWSHLLDPELGIPWAGIYADPPYCLEAGKNTLYGDKGSTHAAFDHDLFAARMRTLTGGESGVATASEEAAADG
jgi:DNA adenine methylase